MDKKKLEEVFRSVSSGTDTAIPVVNSDGHTQTCLNGDTFELAQSFGYAMCSLSEASGLPVDAVLSIVTIVAKDIIESQKTKKEE